MQRQPAPEWQESYDLYEDALDAFAEYVAEIESAVREGNTGVQPEIENLKMEWQDYVEQSVQAVPIAN
jgi:hypothetical protein